VHAEELVDRFYQENPEAIRAIDLKEEELDKNESMPYVHSTNAMSTVHSATLQTFFPQRPVTPVVCCGDQPHLITVEMLLGPSFQHPQDQGEASESKEEEWASSNGEVHSTYATPLSSAPSTFSFNIDLSTYDANNHQPDRRAIPTTAMVESQMQVRMSGGMLKLQCRVGGKIMTGGYLELTVKSRWVAPASANYLQSKESQQGRLKFKITDSLWNQPWPKKLEPGEIVPPPLVQMSQLMMHTGHLVQTMTGFMPWDLSLVDDGGRIIAESLMIGLDPAFSS
jgi:hypothetical protein